jgi:hypothetical protein
MALEKAGGFLVCGLCRCFRLRLGLQHLSRRCCQDLLHALV